MGQLHRLHGADLRKPVGIRQRRGTALLSERFGHWDNVSLVTLVTRQSIRRHARRSCQGGNHSRFALRWMLVGGAEVVKPTLAPGDPKWLVVSSVPSAGS